MIEALLYKRTMPTMRLIQPAVPSSFDLHIASHVFKKKKKSLNGISLNIWDLVCGILGVA